MRELKRGDVVRVVKFEDGGGFVWLSVMNKLIGQDCVVRGVDEYNNAVRVEYGGEEYYFPAHCVYARVAGPPETPSTCERVKKILDTWIVKDELFDRIMELIEEVTG